MKKFSPIILCLFAAFYFLGCFAPSNYILPDYEEIDYITFPEFTFPPPHYSKIEKYSINVVFGDSLIFRESNEVYIDTSAYAEGNQIYVDTFANGEINDFYTDIGTTEKINKFFTDTLTFGDVNENLTEILLKAGFVNNVQEDLFSYFQLKTDGRFKGYAIITDFEKIDKNGVVQNDRFNLAVNKSKKKSFMEYLLPSILHKGHFRFFAFLITDDYYGNKNKRLTKNESFAEIESGAIELHPLIRSRILSTNVKIHVLVYEFEQYESDQDGEPIKMENLTVEDHLREAGIWKYFKM